MRRRIKQEENSLNMSPLESWRITFSDMITLLMTFFVMIVAMSTINEKTVMKRLSLDKDKVAIVNIPVEILPNVNESSISGQSVSSANLLNKIRLSFPEDKRGFFISESERGIALSVPASLIFEAAGGKLNKNASKYLNTIASSLKETQDFISIEGHSAKSEDDEADSKLSLGMAASALDYFIFESGMSPTRFSITGYGSKRPLIDKNAKTPVSDNNRLEIIILKVRPYTETAGTALIE
jgi:chemotaxis protein MotB